MTEKLKVYIDRLREEKIETIGETLSPAFIIDVDEPDLRFNSPVKIQGKAYLAEEHLVIQLKIETKAVVSCSICNEPVKTTIQLQNYYQTEELSQIKGHVYDYMASLREAILLEVPSFVECMRNCPKRAELKKYLHEDKKNPKEQGDQVNFPFANLK